MNFAQSHPQPPPKLTQAAFPPIYIMPLPDQCLDGFDDPSFPQPFSKLELALSKDLAQNQSLASLVEKMETESDGNDEIETNNLNSSCALTILNKSSLNQSLELDNEVFYEVCEQDENTQIEEATLNFLKTLNKPFILQNQAFGFEGARRNFKRKVQVRVGRRRPEASAQEKIEKRKGMEWEGDDNEMFMHKLKKLKV